MRPDSVDLFLATVVRPRSIAPSEIKGVGVVPTILGMGLLYVAVTQSMVFNPALRRMDLARTSA